MKEIEPDQIKQAAHFMRRMLPHLLSGMTFEQAGQQVLGQDRALASIALSNTDVGAAIRQELCLSVYKSIKSAGAL